MLSSPSAAQTASGSSPWYKIKSDAARANSCRYGPKSIMPGLLITQISASRAAGSLGAEIARSIIRRENATSSGDILA